MNDGQLHQVSAEIGGLKKSVEIMTDLWKTQEASAAAGRRALHEKFDLAKDEIGLQVAGLSLRVDRLADRFDLIEPAVNGYKEEKLRDEGAKRLGVKLYAALVAGATLLGYVGHEVITYFRHP